ncbi:MAG: hypothetical protein QOG23_477 [Blastocatellia bacterium]|jgi:hypothetical protein|nr:hypothetical protein [Blastocatellia bacterium]
MTLTRNYLLNCRNFTIAICFVFLAFSAQAQTADVDKNWTTVGSAGTLDESAVGKVFFDQSKVQFGQVGGTTTTGNPALISTQTDSAVIRYNVTAVDSFFAPRICRTNKSLISLDVRLRLRYLASGPGARVVAKLIEVDLATGTEKPLLTFDSAGPGLSLSDNYQVQSISVCGRPWNFDFQNKAYYIEARLTVNSIGISAAGIQMIQIDNFTRPDPCAALVERVRAAQTAVDNIQREIKKLQAQLNGQTGPGSKSSIIAEIKRISDEELPPAEAALREARTALSICRSRTT